MAKNEQGGGGRGHGRQLNNGYSRQRASQGEHVERGYHGAGGDTGAHWNSDYRHRPHHHNSRPHTYHQSQRQRPPPTVPTSSSTSSQGASNFQELVHFLQTQFEQETSSPTCIFYEPPPDKVAKEKELHFGTSSSEIPPPDEVDLPKAVRKQSYS